MTDELEDRAERLEDDHLAQVAAADRAAEQAPAPADPLWVSVGPERIVLTAHAVERYAERMSRFKDTRSAGLELQRMAQTLGQLGCAPSWWRAEEEYRASTFLLIGANVALPLRRDRNGWVATTCVSRGWVERHRVAGRQINERSAGR